MTLHRRVCACRPAHARAADVPPPQHAGGGEHLRGGPAGTDHEHREVLPHPGGVSRAAVRVAAPHASHRTPGEDAGTDQGTTPCNRFTPPSGRSGVFVGGGGFVCWGFVCVCVRCLWLWGGLCVCLFQYQPTGVHQCSVPLQPVLGWPYVGVQL